MKKILPTTLSWRFGLLLLLLAAISLVTAAQASIDTNANTRCLADYAKRQAEVSKARAAATAESNAATAAVINPLVGVILDATNPRRAPAPVDLAELRKAAKRYKVADRVLAEKRAANPLPDFPAECTEDNR